MSFATNSTTRKTGNRKRSTEIEVTGKDRAGKGFRFSFVTKHSKPNKIALRIAEKVTSYVGHPARECQNITWKAL